VNGAEVVILSGGELGEAGRYGDPWHPFAETSALVASALAALGARTRVTSDVDDELARHAEPGAAAPALLIVNIGWYGQSERFEPDAVAGFEALLASSVPVLVLHSSLTAFPDWPRWEQIAGGRWIYDVTYHPDAGPGRALVARDHTVTAGLSDFDVVDERYTRLHLADGASVFLEHEEAGALHPLAWTHRVGRSRVVADALGHAAPAYGPGRLTLLEREVRWLLGDD
jgi:uncharacterized protein